jgi:FKBP-type peptidyl-prolyl cis-trans isomerase 2
VNRTGPIANTSFTAGQYYTIHSKTSNATSVIRILNVTPLTVTWDQNNPLAGQNLSFTVQVVSVNKGSAGSAGGTTLPRIDSAFDVPVPTTNATKNFSASLK